MRVFGMRTIGNILLSFVLAFGPAFAPFSAVRADYQEGFDCAQRMVYSANDRGYRLRNDDSDRLVQGQVASYTVTFSRGVSYVIFACGDRRAYDLDIYLYDEEGNLIDRDRATDNQPVVTVTPAWTGQFTVRVRNYESAGTASYTMAILYQQ
jgi:hypothetical protein